MFVLVFFLSATFVPYVFLPVFLYFFVSCLRFIVWWCFLSGDLCLVISVLSCSCLLFFLSGVFLVRRFLLFCCPVLFAWCFSWPVLLFWFGDILSGDFCQAFFCWLFCFVFFVWSQKLQCRIVFFKCLFPWFLVWWFLVRWSLSGFCPLLLLSPDLRMKFFLLSNISSWVFFFLRSAFFWSGVLFLFTSQALFCLVLFCLLGFVWGQQFCRGVFFVLVFLVGVIFVRCFFDRCFSWLVIVARVFLFCFFLGWRFLSRDFSCLLFFFLVFCFCLVFFLGWSLSGGFLFWWCFFCRVFLCLDSCRVIIV